MDQKAENIIERKDIDRDELNERTWIPHRYMIKIDEHCSIKIRPVFNCSLSTGDCAFLNYYVYLDINLFTNMLELLIKFKMDRYIRLADIYKAFLMICLKNERDKNHWVFLSYFIKLWDKLVGFRYKTLMFEFIESPFILNFVIKHDIEKYSESLTRDMLHKNLYVD